jgi:DNA polymerase III subunit delta'
MDIYAANDLPWLKAPADQLARDLDGARIAHAILIVSAEGLGADALADWISAAVLCESQPVPCGQCASCRLMSADNHPDFHRVQRQERAQQLKIEQIRDLIDVLSLTSYRGRGKVGVVLEAETLNTHSANAFLKTLEEPAAGTLLILVARPAHRLPATIASRCRRLNLSVPSTDLAQRWLAAQPNADASYTGALALAQGAPLLAAAIGEQRADQLIGEVNGGLAQLERRTADPSLVAGVWAQGDAGLRLAWLENWITSRLRESQTVDPVVLSPTLLKAKMRGLFTLLDELREVRRLMSTSANLQLAIESLLLRHFFAG